MARRVLVIAFVSVLLCPVLAVEADACARPSCDRGNESETVSVLQLSMDTARRQSRHLQLPSWSDPEGAASDVLDDAQAGALVQRLNVLTATLNRTLGSVKVFTDDYLIQMRDGQLDLKDGMAAILAMQFKINATPLYRHDEELIEKVRSNIDVACVLWGRICVAGQSVGATMATALTAMSADTLKARVEKSLNSANVKCSEAATKLDELRVKFASFFAGISTSLVPARGESQLSAQHLAVNEAAENAKDTSTGLEQDLEASLAEGAGGEEDQEGNSNVTGGTGEEDPVQVADISIASEPTGVDSRASTNGSLVSNVDSMHPGDTHGGGVIISASGVEGQASGPSSVAGSTESNARRPLGPKVDGVYPGDVQGSGIASEPSGADSMASDPAIADSMSDDVGMYPGDEQDIDTAIVASGAVRAASDPSVPNESSKYLGDMQDSGIAGADSKASEPLSTGSISSDMGTPFGDKTDIGTASVGSGTESNASALEPLAPDCASTNPGDEQVTAGTSKGAVAEASLRTQQSAQNDEIEPNILLQLPIEHPTRVCRDFNTTLQDTLKQVQVFAVSFNEVFDDLTSSVGGTFHGQLNSASLAKVLLSFASLSNIVESFTGGALNGTDFLLTGLQEGVGVAGLAVGVNGFARKFCPCVPCSRAHNCSFEHCECQP